MTLIKSSETLNLNGLTPDDLLGVVQARLEMIAYRTLRYNPHSAPSTVTIGFYCFL
jgi:hypothetical protein